MEVIKVTEKYQRWYTIPWRAEEMIGYNGMLLVYEVNKHGVEVMFPGGWRAPWYAIQGMPGITEPKEWRR